jgi:hypothetical protein
MKLLAYNDKAHRPTCKRVEEKGVLTPITEAIKLAPATCCHPERLEAWKAATAQPEPEPVVTVAAPVVKETVTAPVVDTSEHDPETETRVAYPDSLARHFFRSLAKVGGSMVAGELGVPYRTRGVEFCVFLGGDSIANLDTYLPALWIAADAALKEWRKTSPAYKAFDLSDKEEAKAAYAAEQEFLEDFCAANTIHPRRKNTPGYHAGAAWRLL